MTNNYYTFKSREECERFLKQQYIDYLVHSGTIEYSDYLMHYGRLGMKWGQNRFGKKVSQGVSRTRKRAMSIVKKLKAKRLLKKAVKKQKKEEKKTGKKSQEKSKKKSAKDMTNEELDSATRRLQKENLYNQELARQTPAKKKSFGSKIADAAKEGLAAGVKGLITSEVQNVGKKLINDMMTDPDTAKLKTVSTQKKIKEAEIWLDEARRTGKLPAWDDRIIKMVQVKQGGKKKEKKAA